MEWNRFKEIIDLGYEIERVEDGRITFSGNLLAICRANVFLITAERVMIQVGRVKAQTYDELFEAVKALKWSDFIPENGKFWVKKASSVKSKLFSPSDIQRIVKKAIVENLKQEYGVSWFSEDGAS
ncbi:MAG: THUMP domain-containing protein, partial [Eubacterium sp.]